MCTCIDFKTKDTYFGRNLDLEYHFNEKVVVTPRNYEFMLKNGKSFKTKYAMIGMAMISENYPLYAEAANEEGLAIAGLYFPGSARYNNIENNKLSLAPYELIPYFLGLYKSVIELRKDLVNLNIIDIPYNSDLPLTDLHWMISDGKECIVVEQTYDGLKIYDNPVGILTNNPSFDYQLTNLNNYSNLTPYYQNSKFSKNVELNTDNPYFTIGLLQAKDMIKGRYRALAKKNKMDGIEPPLYFDNVENRSLGSRGGVVPSDNSYVGINFSLADDKTKLVKILGHECEHLFKQNAYIHLSGLQNMMSENIISKRFFRGIEKRFNLIKKNTQKYQDAVQCLYEKNNYEKLVITSGEFDIDKYNNLYKEKCANLAGEIEVEDFQEYLKDLRQNFSLFNRNYVLQKK